MSIGPVTTPTVTTPTAPTAATKPAETPAATTPATTAAADKFEAAQKAPVALTPPAAEEDDFGCDFENVRSGGGGIAALDPSNGGTRIRG